MSARKRATENQAADARLEELRQRDLAAEEGGGAERREKQHQAGKLSARERIELLLDPESFKPMMGAPFFTARSITLQIFSAFASLKLPPKTVKSWAKT